MFNIIDIISGQIPMFLPPYPDNEVYMVSIRCQEDAYRGMIIRRIIIPALDNEQIFGYPFDKEGISPLPSLTFQAVYLLNPVVLE